MRLERRSCFWQWYKLTAPHLWQIFARSTSLALCCKVRVTSFVVNHLYCSFGSLFGTCCFVVMVHAAWPHAIQYFYACCYSHAANSFMFGYHPHAAVFLVFGCHRHAFLFVLLLPACRIFSHVAFPGITCFPSIYYVL